MRSNIKGGSKASDLVMSTNPVLCGDESPVLLGKQFDFDPEQLTLYKTTGGARKSYRNKRKSNKQKGGDSCNKKYGAHENNQHGGDSCNKKYGAHENNQHGGDSCNKKYGAHENNQHGGDSCNKKYGAHENNQHGGDSCNKKYGAHENHQHGGDSCNKKYGAHENHQHGGKKKSRKKNKKSKSSRRKNIRKSNNRSKRKNIRRNKRGGSKASNAVLKGSPCNTTNLVGGGTNNAFIGNNCRGKSQSGGSATARGSATASGSPAPILNVDDNAVVPPIYNDSKLYKTIFAPGYPNLCLSKGTGTGTGTANNKENQTLYCYINFFKILYSNIAKLYYFEAAHKGDISVSQSVLNYFNNTDILNGESEGYYLNKYNDILKPLQVDIRLTNKYKWERLHIQTKAAELIRQFKPETAHIQQKIRKQYQLLQDEKDSLELKILKETTMLKNMKEIIGKYANCIKTDCAKTWTPLSGGVQTSFQLYINDLIINGLVK